MSGVAVSLLYCKLAYYVLMRNTYYVPKNFSICDIPSQSQVGINTYLRPFFGLNIVICKFCVIFV